MMQGKLVNTTLWAIPTQGSDADQLSPYLMARKAERQAAILELVGRTAFRSQEELRKLLAARGIEVTQATLSRDIRDLALIRVPTDEGHQYAPHDALPQAAHPSL